MENSKEARVKERDIKNFREEEEDMLMDCEYAIQAMQLIQIETTRIAKATDPSMWDLRKESEIMKVYMKTTLRALNIQLSAIYGISSKTEEYIRDETPESIGYTRAEMEKLRERREGWMNNKNSSQKIQRLVWDISVLQTMTHPKMCNFQDENEGVKTYIDVALASVYARFSELTRLLKHAKEVLKGDERELNDEIPGDVAIIQYMHNEINNVLVEGRRKAKFEEKKEL